MKKTVFTVCAAVGLAFASCSEAPVDRPWNDGVNIIPMPAEMQVAEGSFKLSSSTVLSANTEEGQQVAQFFADKLAKSTGFQLKVSGEAKSSGIVLNIDPALEMNEEGYHLNVAADAVKIEAKTAAGAFYGMQTLLQLLPAEVESPTVVKNIAWEAQACDIKDEPRYMYRGFHFDPCRHFFTVDEVKKLIDALSVFKINRMHFHLTDDQGWRIEIKAYPKLQEVASKRIEGDGTEYGGYYTQEQIKEIVAYAAKHFVDVIPEIELPGHELAAIAAYPELACNTTAITPRILWGVEDVVMCPGKEDMFVFLENVFKEVIPLFPSKYFHVGGDECPKHSWENCPACQARIKELGLKDKPGQTAEQQLQSYVVERMEKVLVGYGKKLIGWDEILEGGLSPDATVMSWRGPEGGLESALQGHDAIMTPSSEGMYLDYYQGDNKIEPVSIGGYYTLEKCYNYNPTPDTLVVLKKDHHILGVQGNTWTEYIPDGDILEYRMFPRMIAIAEIGWTPLAKKDYKDFERRINNAYVRLDGHKINYHIPQPEQPNGSCNFVAFTDKATLEFKTSRPIKVVYTLDGTEPNANSTEYTTPIEISETTTLKICSVLPSGKTSPIRTITVEKQALSPATEVADAKPGLKMKKTYGVYLNAKDLEKATEWEDLIVKGTFDIRSQEPTTEDMRSAKYYSAIAEGYFQIPEDGVYYFSSNNDEVYVDGKLLINNANEVKRFSRHDSSMALAKGLHSIKIVFCGNVMGGWPSQWDDASVKIRAEKAEKFQSIKPEELFYK
ncbi:MAG: family 20 glycosylhydrolase [Bacteroidaceae bacterium]|nr:family 20 glycosylhydrolase [Bacteroidaceae bacterium]